MNYHEWAKTASPYANDMNPQITCSTCMICRKDFQRDDRMQFNPLYGNNMDWEDDIDDWDYD